MEADGRMPTASTATCAGPPRTRTPRSRCEGSVVSRHGWRTAEVLDFVGWLRAHNDSRSPPDAVGFYGLDLYGLYTSIEEVIAYLQKIDPPAADRAGERYACFEHFGGESQEAEGRSAWKQRVLPARRGRAAAGALSQLGRLLRRDGLAAEDDQFYAEQNARLVADAEQHYRTMFAAHVSSWNLRDTHMADGRQSPGPPPTPRGAREARRLGAQLLCRRCASDTDGRVRRTQPRPAHPIATPGRRGARGVYDLLGERHHGLGVGRTGRAQAGPPGAARELRATLP